MLSVFCDARQEVSRITEYAYVMGLRLASPVPLVIKCSNLIGSSLLYRVYPSSSRLRVLTVWLDIVSQVTFEKTDVCVIVACDGIFEKDKDAIKMLRRLQNAIGEDPKFNPQVVHRACFANVGVGNSPHNHQRGIRRFVRRQLVRNRGALEFHGRSQGKRKGQAG